MSNAETINESQDLPLPTSPDDLMARLEALDIPYTLHHHKAVFTVAESDEVDAQIPGTHCRNLFLRDDKKNFFLVVLQNATQVDLKKLPVLIDSKKLSFGASDKLWEHLGVRPGSVCPYSIINDTAGMVKICLDKSMMETDIVNFHPLLNTMTIGVKPADLTRFIENCGHTAHIIDFTVAAPLQE